MGAGERMYTIDLLSKGDEVYYAMLMELRQLERQYLAVMNTLPVEQQDIITDYLDLCEEMSRRQLEIACTHMRFPE